MALLSLPSRKGLFWQGFHNVFKQDGAMKGRKALAVGSCLGSATSVFSLTLHIDEFQILLWSLLSIFAFSLFALTYCSLFGWPRKDITAFDMYDCHKLIVGGGLAAALVATFSATTTKLSFLFSMTLPNAALVALMLFITYLTLMVAFFSFVQQRR